MISPVRTPWGEATLVLLLGFAMCAEFVVAGKFSAFITGDNMDLMLPRLLSGSFGDTGAPLWDRLTTGGMDRPTFALLGWIDVVLFDVLPPWLAHVFRIATQFLAAIAGVYVLVRWRLGLGVSAAAFAALMYAMQLEGTLFNAAESYAPLVLLALAWLLEDRRSPTRWAVVVAVSFLAAHTAFLSRLIPFLPVLVVTWFVFIEQETRARHWAIILLVAILPIVLRVEDFLALRAVSPFVHTDLVRTVGAPSEMLRRALDFSAFFQVGFTAICFWLLVLGLTARRLRDRRAIGILVWIIAMVAYKPLMAYVQEALSSALPLLRGAQLERAAIVTNLAVAVGSAFGIEALVRFATGAKRTQKALAGAVLATVFLFPAYNFIKAKYASALGWMTNGNYVANAESPVLRDLAEQIQADGSPVRAETFQLRPGMLHFYGLETAGGYQTFNWRRYYELWAQLVEPWASQVDPESRQGQQFSSRRDQIGPWPRFRGDRLMLFPETFAPEVSLGALYRLNILSLLNVGYLVSRDRLTDPQLRPIVEAPAPFSSLSTEERARVNLTANFRGREALYIYENTAVLPRFFTVGALSVFETPGALLGAIGDAAPQTLRTTAFVGRRDLPADLDPGTSLGVGAVSVVSYDSDRIVLRVRAGTPTVLVAANAYSPFWKARINGQSAALFPAYHALWGLAMPAGDSEVVLTYEPPYPWWGR